MTEEKQFRAYFIYFTFKGEDKLNRFFVIAHNRKESAHIFRMWATAKRFYHLIEAGAYAKIAPKSKINNSLVDKEHYYKQFETLKELLVLEGK